jgi:hypothetical protein
MKTVTVIIIILFIAALSLFGIIGLKYIGVKIFSGPETQEIPGTDNDITTVQEDPEVTTEEEPEVEIDPENISEIEIYLDSSRESGIFLGNAVYGMTSEEAFMIYGEDFSESGFLLVTDNVGFIFEPGSIHHLYIYTLIPEYGWDYIRKRILIPGDPDEDENIKLSVDNPSQNEVIKEDDKSNIRISGWSVDFNYSDNTGVERIEVYLNGPRNFGEFLGEADYGTERPDVANTFGNANYTNSGYSLYFDGSSLEEGSENTLYVYSYSNSGNYSVGMRDFKIEGEKANNAIISVEEHKLDDQTIEITGWATNKKWAIEGKPRSLDIEYATKKIIFTSDRNGNEDIFSMDLDGAELTQLTDHQGNDNYPAVSPDGEKIAYTSDIDGIWQIMVMNWDGTEKTQLTQNPWRSGYPAWSFDGRFIFFEVYQDGDWEIYRINSDGSNMKRLTLNPGASDWHPCGHPFQYKIIYESGNVRDEDIYIMDYNGDDTKKISNADMRKRVPAVSVDGEMIVFAVYKGDNSYIYTMDINGENLNNISGSLTKCSHPNISPDNDYIAFECIIGGKEDLYIVSPDGTGLNQLTNTASNDRDPAFMYQIH